MTPAGRTTGGTDGCLDTDLDQPSNSVVAADNLISRVMGARGYPAESFAARVSVISVDQPDIVDEYRQAHRVYHRAQSQQASTEDLRGALLSYRSIFDHLVQPSGTGAATEYGSGIYVVETTPRFAEPTTQPTGATEPGDGRGRPAEDGGAGYREGGSAGYAEDAAHGTGQPTAAQPARRDS
jgi:hypothetical protein